MKKLLALLLAAIMCLSLVACGKSEEVKNAEVQITTLTNNSTYQEIHDVYLSYTAVEFDDREKGKVENEAELAKYCDLLNGHFTLNDAMIETIEGAFKGYGDIGYSHAIYAIQNALSIEAIIKGWTKYRDIEIASRKQIDDYTIVGYGTLMIMDEYGNWSSHKLEIEYFTEYNEEDEKGYSVSQDIRFY